MKFVHKDDQVQFCGIVQLSLYLNEVNLHDRLKTFIVQKLRNISVMCVIHMNFVPVWEGNNAE